MNIKPYNVYDELINTHRADMELDLEVNGPRALLTPAQLVVRYSTSRVGFFAHQDARKAAKLPYRHATKAEFLRDWCDRNFCDTTVWDQT